MLAASQVPPARPVSLVAHLLILLGAAVSVLFAGGPQQGSLGIFLLFAGGALVACPPQVRVDPRLCMLAGGLVLAASLAFLPHSWLPAAPWRQQLIDAGVPLGKHISPVPRETAFWLAIFSTTIATALLALAHPLRSRVQLQLALVAVALVGAYVTLAFVVQKSGWEFPYDANPRDFGFFLNRNHTASFLATGSLISLGLLALAIRSGRWWHGCTAAAVLVACLVGLLFFGTSRGGMLVFLAGMALWMAGLGREHRTRPMVISTGAIGVAAGILFLAAPGAVRERLLESVGKVTERVVATEKPAGDAEERPFDARLIIFGETLKVIRDFPLTGIGLGAFRPVFVYYNDQLPPDPPIGHPESDWLMLASEIGVASVPLLIAAFVLLLRQVWHFREHAYWPLRWGLLCAALAAFLHGFVDVPAHRAALGWWVLALAGLGTQVMASGMRRPQRWLHVCFIVIGLVAMGLGGRLLQSDFSRAPALPPLEAMWAEGEVIEWREGGRFADSEAAAFAAIRRSPMYPPLQFHHGVSLLSLNGDREAVDAAFQRERLLVPRSPQVAANQGLFWAEIDPQRAIALWQEALQQQERIDQGWPLSTSRTGALFHQLLRECAPAPETQRSLLAAAEGRPALVLQWIRGAAPEIVASELPRLAANPAIASNLSPRERRFLLEQWYARSDRQALFAFVEQHEDWKAPFVPIGWRHLADTGRHEEAVLGRAKLYGVNLDLPPVDGREPAAATDGEPDALTTFRSAWSKGNTRTARRMLEEMRKARPPFPEALRLLTSWSVRDAQWQAAWQFLDEYISAARLEAPF